MIAIGHFTTNTIKLILPIFHRLSFSHLFPIYNIPSQISDIVLQVSEVAEGDLSEG